MSTNKKNYPNDYYAWYNDDNRFAVVEKVTSSGDGSVHHDAYDSIQTSSDMLTGTMTEMVTDGSTVIVTCSAAHGLTASTDKVTITGTRHYDGNYTVASTPTTTTFTFASSALGGTADNISGLVVLSNVATATTSAAAKEDRIIEMKLDESCVLAQTRRLLLICESYFNLRCNALLFY